MSTTLINNNLIFPLSDLPLDPLTLICEHLNMQEACNLYRTGSKNLMEAIAETEFDFYRTREWIPKGVSVKQFRKVFASAIGIRTSEPYKITNEDFDYLVPSLCKNNPKGLAKVSIDMSNPYGYCSFRKYSKKAFEKLKGIHLLDISNNKLVRYRHLKSLKDIKCLIMSECSHIHQSVLQYFTKVKCLVIDYCYQMTDQALSYLNSNDLETLVISGCDISYEALGFFCEIYPNVTWYYDENVDFDDINYEYYYQEFKLDELKFHMGFGPDEYYYDDYDDDYDSLIDDDDYEYRREMHWRDYKDDD